MSIPWGIFSPLPNETVGIVMRTRQFVFMCLVYKYTKMVRKKIPTGHTKRLHLLPPFVSIG